MAAFGFLGAQRLSPLPSLSAFLLLAVALPLTAQDGKTKSAPPPSQPWRLSQAVGCPPWLKVSGEHRTRFETLNGQFRAAPTLADTDDQVMLRTLLRADVDFDPVGGTVEVIDARAYGSDDGSLLDTSIVDTVDLLQAHVTFALGKFAGGEHRLLAGREALDLGSRRLVARNAYRNTINSFNGVDYLWQDDAGTSAHLFWTLPTMRRPGDFASLRDNDHDWDDQDLDLQFMGGHAGGRFDERTHWEGYAYGLYEHGTNTRRRRLVTPGLRLVRTGKPGQFFGEIEAAYQFGESKSSTSVTAPELDHSAWFGHVSVGFTFDVAWQPAVRLAYDYASGDSDPNDGDNGRFDTLFGARRFEYGPTGLWGAVARSNLSSPELRVSLKPGKNVRVIAAYRDVRLAAERDTWTTAGVRDSSGSAGDHVGQQVELRLQWDPWPKNLRIEAGGAYLVAGRFQEDAPNGRGGDSRYGYVEMVWTF